MAAYSVVQPNPQISGPSQNSDAWKIPGNLRDGEGNSAVLEGVRRDWTIVFVFAFTEHIDASGVA
jgi:hypothetical protein